MITGALVAYLKANLSLTSVYVNRAPLNSQPCIVIDEIGDSRDRYWRSGKTHSGLTDREYELSVFTDLANGGPRYASVVADEILTLLDNYSGPMTDTGSSPNVSHRIAFIEASNGGGDFDPEPEIYGHSVLLTITHD